MASENINAPDAVDDIEVVPIGTTISVQISLFDNDSEPDGESFFISNIVQPVIGSVVIDDAAAGLVTYSYSASTLFPGTSFDYTISDSPILVCPALGRSNTATVTIEEPCADPSGLDSDGDGINDICDLDDDNDGILDTVERAKTVLWVTQGTPETEEQNTIDKLTALGYTVTVVDDNVGGNANDFAVTFLYEDVNSGTAYANVTNLSTTTKGVITSENALYDEILGTTGATGNTNTNFINITDNTHPITTDLALGNLDVGDAAFYVNNVVSGQKLGNHPNGQAVLITWEEGDPMDMGIAPGRRTVLPLTNGNGGFNSNGEDLLVNAIIWTGGIDTDKDGIDDHLDLDSDDDGCNDAIEAYSSLSVDQDNNDYFGTGNPPPVNTDGTVVAASYQTPADHDSNGIYDFQEAGIAPSISSEPLNLTICHGCSGTFMVTANNADGYQWQILNGTTWVNLTDSGIHSGTTTAILTITNATPSDNGNQYRVLVSNSLFTCTNTVSNTTILTVNVSSVITNRRITFRVKKN